MVRGADKSVADKKGSTPADLVSEIKSPQLATEIAKMLGRPGTFDCLMLSAQTRYIARSNKTMIVYLSFFFYVLAVEVFFVFPSK